MQNANEMFINLLLLHLTTNHLFVNSKSNVFIYLFLYKFKLIP